MSDFVSADVAGGDVHLKAPNMWECAQNMREKYAENMTFSQTRAMFGHVQVTKIGKSFQAISGNFGTIVDQF